MTKPLADNEDLVDKLLEGHYISTPEVEKAFRAVDRGIYFFPESRMQAYTMTAWKDGNIHISSPNIYSMVMEHLKLGPGMSFLNIGSGTGYLSTMVGIIIGPSGTNHGVEIHQDVIDYAYKRLDEFYKTLRDEFCGPYFIKGNGLCLANDTDQYDRVYCGASCPENFVDYMKNLIKVGGILVIPLGTKLLQITRTSQTQWVQKCISGVVFAPLQLPTLADRGSPVHFPKFSVLHSTLLLCGTTRRIVDEYKPISLSSWSSEESESAEAGKSSTDDTKRENAGNIVGQDTDKGKDELLEDLRKVINRLQELVECPVCYGTLDSTLIQCKFGHGICSSCASQVQKCPSCQQELVVHKSTLLGQILECLPKLCPYVDKGCSVIVLDKDHDSFCEYRPSICKNVLCSWEGCVKDLINHVKSCEKSEVCEISSDTKKPQYFTIDRTQDVFFYIPIIFENQLFWEYFHRNAATKRLSYRFYHVATSKPTCSYYFVVSFKKGKIEQTNSVKALVDVGNNGDDEGEIGVTFPDSQLEKFQSSSENGKYEYSIEVVTEDIV